MNPTALIEALESWMAPLRPVLDPQNRVDWQQLTTLATELDALLVTHPIEAAVLPGRERSRRLCAIRAELARRGLLEATRQPAPFHVLAQFMCGYRDIDLRDAVGLGHGVLIARHGKVDARRRWLPRLRIGELAGVAVTESHGGSRPAATRTCATAQSDGTWLVTGSKTWISRLTEASVFVVFFRGPDGRLAAAAVDAAEQGLRREPIPPAGLAGWSWGTLRLDAVRVRQENVLRGDGMALLRRHFAGYRPLVAATALGGAAAVFDMVTAGLASRQATGEIPRLRDSALVTLGRAHAELVTALLGTVVAACLADAGHVDAERWGAAMKAHGVDTANQTTAELTLLLGAAGFRADCHLAKVRRDLNGLLYADGIHDSLYLAAGRRHTAPHSAVPKPRGASEPVANGTAPERTGAA